jgi:hypothetical protein
MIATPYIIGMSFDFKSWFEAIEAEFRSATV